MREISQDDEWILAGGPAESLMKERAMPRGRPAKRDHSRKRDDFVFRTVEGDIESHPEERPMPDDLLPEGEEWHPGTRRWWKVWSESPLAKDLPESDWPDGEAAGSWPRRRAL